MKRIALLLLFVGGIAAPAAFAQPGAVHRFAAIDVYLVSPEPVAAWQFEFRSSNARIVGIENGDSKAFGETPYYDRAAIERGTAERIVVADFSLENADALPSGRIRIATLHLALDARGEPDFDLELVTAVREDGEPIDASIGMERRTGGAG